MITSNISGRRLVPFFKVTVAYIRRMYQQYPNAFTFYGFAPSFEVAVESGAVTAARVDFLTGAETPLTAAGTTSHSERGVAYTIHKFNKQTNTNGTFYYKVTVGTAIYYSAPFSVMTCSSDFKLSYSHSCTGFLTGSEGHTNEISFLELDIVPDGVEGSEEGFEIAGGTTEITQSHVRTVWRFSFVGTRAIYERLQHVRHFDQVTMTAFGTAYAVKKGTFELEGNKPDDFAFIITGTFQLEEVDEIIHCACPGFDAEGGDIGNGNGGSSDTAHPNLNVSIDDASLPQLSAVITGDEPLTPRLVRWYKNGVFFSNTETITIPNETATWELRVKVDGHFEQTSTYSYVNECNLFDVFVSVTQSTITANYENIPNGQTVSISVKDEQGQEVATSLPYTPANTGTYTVEATAGLCVKSQSVYVASTSDDCAHVVTVLEQADGTLQADIANSQGGLQQYQWEYVNEDNELSLVGTASTHFPQRTGMYRVRVTEASCPVYSDQRLVIKATPVEIVSPIHVILDNRWRYEAFTINTNSNNAFDGSSNRLTVTRGVLPDLTGLTLDQIGKRIAVFYNQNKLTHKDPTTYTAEFSVDGQDIILHENLDQWAVISVYFLEDLQ